jgi:hypothetical protein
LKADDFIRAVSEWPARYFFAFGSVAVTLLLLSHSRWADVFGLSQGPAWLRLALTLATLMCFAVAAVKGGTYLTSKWQKRAERQRVERQRIEAQEKLSANVRRLLPDLPDGYLNLLAAFTQGTQTVTFTSEYGYLVDNGFLEVVSKLDYIHVICQLRPIARPIVEQFFKEERRRALEQHLARLEESEKEFLRLFLHPAPTEPPKPDAPLMPSEVYEGAQTLVRQGILERVKPADGQRIVETVFMPDDVVELVESRVLGKPVQRRSIELDPARIASRVSRGSGAGPGITYERQTGN